MVQPAPGCEIGGGVGGGDGTVASLPRAAVVDRPRIQAGGVQGFRRTSVVRVTPRGAVRAVR